MQGKLKNSGPPKLELQYCTVHIQTVSARLGTGINGYKLGEVESLYVFRLGNRNDSICQNWKTGASFPVFPFSSSHSGCENWKSDVTKLKLENWKSINSALTLVDSHVKIADFDQPDWATI